MTLFDIPTVVLVYGACGMLYLLLALLVLARRPRSTTGMLLALAAVVTFAWGVSVALQWWAPVLRIAAWLELARPAAWYGFILYLYRRWLPGQHTSARWFTALGAGAGMVLIALPFAGPGLEGANTLWSLTTVLRLGFPVASLLLLENLYRNTAEEARWHVNLLCVALAGMSLYDLVLYADAILFRMASPVLFAARAPIFMLAAPLIALAAARNRTWRIDIHISRTVVFHSATLVAAGTFLLALALTGEVLRRREAPWGQVAEMTLLFGGIMAVAVLVTSGSARSRLRQMVADHFFSRRYDYHAEWLRCIDTLTSPDTHVGLHLRAVRAAANVVDSPAGALFVRAPEDVAFQWAGSWNMPAVTLPIPPGHPLIPAFRDGDWIVQLDTLAESRDWFAELKRVWLAVPLSHFGTLIGFVVLAPSRAPFRLDRESFALLRVVGREIASRVAEQRAAQVLSQTRELREYSQRFAFVIHDIKNVSGQLTMLLSNAEVHADNPEFQRDMLATVRASVAKITRLLNRLAAEQQERSHALLEPGERLRDLIETCRVTRHAEVTLDDSSAGAGIGMDPEAFDAVVTHLLNNAVEASGPQGAVHVSARREAVSLVIDIVDEGPGMRPEFVRDELFRPFTSTKGGGHGIGAYQARELLREAGGDLLVLSRPEAGTTMRILLPSVRSGAVVAPSSV